ncbi:Sensor histidine kinase LiaS [compost metagenome]
MVKHANADQLVVAISESANTLRIKVADNGKGFDPNSRTNGNGLRNMHKRVSALNGKLSITTEIGNGTSIQIELPI